jgi:hypothetical protein
MHFLFRLKAGSHSEEKIPFFSGDFALYKDLSRTAERRSRIKWLYPDRHNVDSRKSVFVSRAPAIQQS